MIDVNLLPEEQKKDIEQAKRNAVILSYTYKAIFLLLSVGIIFSAAHYFFNAELKTNLKSQIAAEEKLKKYTQTEAKATKISQKLEKIKKIDQGRFIWSKLLSEIDNITPSNVVMNSLKLDSSTKNRATFSGTTNTKKDVADYRDALEKSDYFEFVDIDSSQNKGPTEETFSISFTISKDALK